MTHEVKVYCVSVNPSSCYVGQVSSTSNGDSASTALTQPESDAGSLVPSSTSSPASSSLVVTTTVAMTTTSIGVSGTTNSPRTSNPSYTSVMFIHIVPTTGGQGGNGPSAGLATGVALGVVLAVVGVVVVVVIALVVCSVQRRRKKYDLGCNRTYEVPYDAYIGKFSKHWHTFYFLI